MTHDFIDTVKKIIGDAYVITDLETLTPYIREYRGRYTGKALAVIKPKDTNEVSKIVKLCHDKNIPIVPQGGNTSLVGGSIAYDDQAIILNLSRLNTVFDMDVHNFSVTVGAGVILKDLQDLAQENDRYFPLSLGAEGSCQIGGNIASNAGGMLTIGYGNMRDLVLGLEVVLPNGNIWNGLRRLRKDNTGYDLKHLFIGSEGTLGIVTAAVLKLFPLPKYRETFFAGVQSPAQAIELLTRCRATAGDNIMAFELIPRLGIDLALKHLDDTVDPLEQAYPWYVLAELSAGNDQQNFRDSLETLLSQAFDDKIIGDATLADSQNKQAQLWYIREAIVEAQRMEGGSIKHDIAVPVSSIPEFLDRALACVYDIMPDIRPIPFGHLGDGNLHFNLTQPEDMSREEFLAQWDNINHKVHDIVVDLGGSIAAEHGVGTFKLEELPTRKSTTEMNMMRAVKKALDPKGLMNPNVIFKA